MTFGDVDAYKKRGYMFTLRTASSGVVIHEMSSKHFMLYLSSRGKDKDFGSWAKKQDLNLINKLADTLIFQVRGCNIDGKCMKYHQYANVGPDDPINAMFLSMDRYVTPPERLVFEPKPM